MKRLIAFLWIALLSVGISTSACAEAVTLAELKMQVPERMQMTVTTDAGETVTVDAPIVLPDADTLPILQAKYMLFDTTDLREKYPIEKGTPSYVRGADAAYNFTGSPLISYYVGSDTDLHGKTDYSTRAILSPSETPSENDWTLDQIVQLVYDRIVEFGGDSSVDLRVYRANAMSGLYRMKMVKVETGESGVSYKMPSIDKTKPIASKGKGIWDVWLTQYFHNIPVFPTAYFTGEHSESSYTWPYPVMGYVNLLDEDTMSMLFSCCVETGVIQNDTMLAPFQKVEQAIRERIQSGQLKSVYQVSLGYAVRLVKGDSFFSDTENTFNANARFVLSPVWQICGYDLKDREHRYFQGFTEPDEMTVMQNLYGDYELWLDAQTVQPMTNDEYDLEGNMQ